MVPGPGEASHRARRRLGPHLRVGSQLLQAPRSEAERELLDGLDGPVLDVGCGVGAYTLYLQNRGLGVTAVDSSPGAIEVCRARGCMDARVMDIRCLALSRGEYRGVVVMGNTLGVHQTPATLPKLLVTLRQACTERARLVCTTIDPLETQEPEHLEYHRSNRARGRPPGLTTIRMRYGDLVGEWLPLWLPTTDELDRAMATSGWDLEARHTSGPHRIDCYAAAGR